MADIFVISDFCWSRPAGEVEITRAWQLAGIPLSEYRKAVYLFCPAVPETATARAGGKVQQAGSQAAEPKPAGADARPGRRARAKSTS